MLLYRTSKQKFAFVLLLSFFAIISINAQQAKRVKPVWWFGESAAANFNFYRGTTQKLENDFSVPTAFHEGKAVKPYFSLLTEYRPGKIWGGMLNVAFDNRGGKFKEVIAPCNCPANLTTNSSYIVVEPSLRVAPFANAFYLFAGPTISVNVSKEYTYKQDKQLDRSGDLSDIRKTVIAAQAGLGVDIPVSKPESQTQMTISPFASFQTDLGQSLRTVESWSMYTIRAGIALKFGTGKTTAPLATTPVPVIISVAVAEQDVQFSVRAPKVVPLHRQVKETFPIRNSVFFNQGSTEIPGRYVLLSQQQAATFKEAQLQQEQPNNLNNGRSARQLAVYHNILNVLGDRLRANSGSTLTLSGSSDNNNAADGKIMAENIKKYLVTVFGIDGTRISTKGTDKPLVPSEQPGGTKELALLRDGDRRVDITTTSPELLMQVGGASSPFLKPVEISTIQEDPLDSHVIFNVAGPSAQYLPVIGTEGALYPPSIFLLVAIFIFFCGGILVSSFKNMIKRFPSGTMVASITLNPLS